MTTWLSEDGAVDPSAVRPVRNRGDGPDDTWTLDHNIGIYLKPLKVLDTRKWFGEADLRLDALVVHGGAEDVASLYHPKTFRFPRVADGDDIATSENGLLVYYGRPAHFVGISLLLARDTKDSDDLAALIKSESASKELASSLTGLVGVLPPISGLAAVQAGLTAALALGDLAYKLVRQVSPTCLGLFRAGWLGSAHRFGIGRHPDAGVERVKDFAFAYDIVVDRTAAAK